MPACWLQYGSTDTGDFFEDCDDPLSNAENCNVDRGNNAATANNELSKSEHDDKLGKLLAAESAWTIQGKADLKNRPSWFSASPSGLAGTLSYEHSGMTLACQVENSAMGFEDFYADFADGLQGSFSVEPVTGTLDRRNDHTAQGFEVVYKGGGKSGVTGHLIIQTEEDKFTFELVVP